MQSKSAEEIHLTLMTQCTELICTVRLHVSTMLQDHGGGGDGTNKLHTCTWSTPFVFNDGGY